MMKKRTKTTLLALTMALTIALPGNAAWAAEIAPEVIVEESNVAGGTDVSANDIKEGEKAESSTMANVQYVEKLVYSVGGVCGDSLNWSYSNGVLSISGSGAMYDYPVYDTPGSSQCMPWYNYKSSITTLNIAEGVTSIGACAFWGCNNLTSVTTPSSLQSIGFAAFADCTAIQQVTIPSGRIGESAFIRCSSLRSATIGGGVTAIGISAFENCNNMNAVHISDVAAWCAIDFGGYLANPLQLAKHLYLNGALVTRLDIPSGVTAIRDYAFEYCADLTSVTIPSSVREIGDYAFYLCTGLSTVSLQPGLVSIGASAFDSCSSLTNITVPSTVSAIGSYAFTWTPITTVSIAQGTIGSHAFEGCGCIWDVRLGENVSYIGPNAFNSCAGLHDVYYGGSPQQWNAITKGENNNALINANIMCSGTGSAMITPIPSGVAVGATVTFGNYEQDNNSGNGRETLEWTILDVQGSKALIITKNVLEFQRYYPNLQTAVTWENSTLRSWMNNTFKNAAFSSGEQASICATTLSNGNNGVYGTNGGANTTDYIFALSASEAERYFATDEARMSGCTAYALNGGSDSALQNGVLGTSYWWLRSSGINTYSAMYVHYTGSLRYDGMAVANTIVGVRPAMWVEASALGVTEDKVTLFVNRLYNVCLNREPDVAGQMDWVNRLKTGVETGTSAAYGFIFSEEFQNYNYCNTDYVKQLYRAFMGREYDEGGLAHWLNLMQSGVTREEVFNGFAQSTEFSNLCAEYRITLGNGISVPQYGTVPKGNCSVCGAQDGVTAFVTRLYNICFSRRPDAAGLQDWTSSLWAHTKSGKEVSFGFIFSEEFTNKGLNDENFVEYLYNAFFDRTADSGGKTDWLARMHTQGYTRVDVFNGFVGSAEFDNLCKRYGITRDN